MVRHINVNTVLLRKWSICVSMCTWCLYVHVYVCEHVSERVHKHVRERCVHERVRECVRERCVRERVRECVRKRVRERCVRERRVHGHLFSDSPHEALSAAPAGSACMWRAHACACAHTRTHKAHAHTRMHTCTHAHTCMILVLNPFLLHLHFLQGIASWANAPSCSGCVSRIAKSEHDNDSGMCGALTDTRAHTIPLQVRRHARCHVPFLLLFYCFLKLL